MKVDLDAVKAAGYDTITPVIVTNSMDYNDVIAIQEGDVRSGETIVKVL